ncbi:MAG: hypothetical protein V4801_37435, partial [Burkholderia gladioli]
GVMTGEHAFVRTPRRGARDCSQVRRRWPPLDVPAPERGFLGSLGMRECMAPWLLFGDAIRKIGDSAIRCNTHRGESAMQINNPPHDQQAIFIEWARPFSISGISDRAAITPQSAGHFRACRTIKSRASIVTIHNELRMTFFARLLVSILICDRKRCATAIFIFCRALPKYKGQYHARVPRA